MMTGANREMLSASVDVGQSGKPLGGLPPGFAVLPDGIHAVEASGAQSWLCSPLKVSARFHDVSSRGWGRVIEVEDPLGKVHLLNVFDSDLNRSFAKVLGELRGIGLRASRFPKVNSLINALISDWAPQKCMTSVDRVGWIDQTSTGFVLGSGRVIGAGDVLPMGSASSPLSENLRPSGSIEMWRETVGKACVGNPLLVLGVAQAFSGPLLDFLGLDMGGGLHFRGASSCGKSTILRVAATVWGGPALVGSWRATANALELVADASNGTLMVLDELAEISARDLDQAIYMLADGTARARMTSSLTQAPRQKWQVAILSSGEISAAEKLAEGGHRMMAGHEVRLVDIVADTRAHGAFDELHGSADGLSFSVRLKAAAGVSYGVSGPAFVERLISQPEKVRRVSAQLIEVVEREGEKLVPNKLDGQASRVLKRFAITAVAGELATRFGLTGWGQGEAKRAALEAFAD